MKGLLWAHRWPTAALLALAVMVLGVAASDRRVGVPLLEVAVPARVLLAIGVSLVALPPLYSAFPELEPTLVREPMMRVVRVCVAVLLAGAALAPALTSDVADGRDEAVLFLTLLAMGIAATTIVGEMAWAVPLFAGLLSLYLDADLSTGTPSLAGQIPVPIAVLALLMAMSIYVRRGPRIASEP